MIDPFTLATGIAGLLSLTIEITKLSQAYVSGVHSASKSKSELIQEVIGLKNVLSDLQDKIVTNPDIVEAFESRCSSVLKRLGTPHAQPQGAAANLGVLETCNSELTNIMNRLIKKTKCKPLNIVLSHLIWPFTEAETQNKVNMLHRYGDIFSMSVNIDTLALAAMSLKEVRTVREEQQHLAAESLQEVKDGRQEHQEWRQSDEQDKILEWLSPLEFTEKQRDISSKRHPGTGRWLLQSSEFETWSRRGGRSDNILWCPGEAGVGKTVLTYVKYYERAFTLKSGRLKLTCRRPSVEFSQRPGCGNRVRLLRL